MRAILMAVVLMAGCDVGEVSVPGPAPGGPDATPAAPGSPDGAPASAGPDAAPSAFTCRDGVNTADTGHHNPGLDCMSSGCHGPGGAGPLWSVAGTLYSSAAGGAPIVGATITVVDANGVSMDLISAQNGNFSTGVAVALPAKIYASKCPALTPMVATAAVGSCNSCHVAGSATGAVHLP